MYNSGTNNVFFVVLQFLEICGSCQTAVVETSLDKL